MRTLHALSWFTDEAFRRRIGRQLNRGEALNDLRRFICFARRGAVRYTHHDDQTTQAHCHPLVVNACILSTTGDLALIGRLRVPSGDRMPVGLWPSSLRGCVASPFRAGRRAAYAWRGPSRFRAQGSLRRGWLTLAAAGITPASPSRLSRRTPTVLPGPRQSRRRLPHPRRRLVALLPAQHHRSRRGGGPPRRLRLRNHLHHAPGSGHLTPTRKSDPPPPTRGRSGVAVSVSNRASAWAR